MTMADKKSPWRLLTAYMIWIVANWSNSHHARHLRHNNPQGTGHYLCVFARSKGHAEKQGESAGADSPRPFVPIILVRLISFASVQTRRFRPVDRRCRASIQSLA